jgi:hypothetical protein
VILKSGTLHALTKLLCFPSGTIPQAPEGIGLEFCILTCPECRIPI